MTYGVFRDSHGHTCIRVLVGRRLTSYIPMSVTEMRVHRAPTVEFDSEYKPLAGYALQRAAKLYLHDPDGVTKEISPEARSHLERIAAGLVATPQPETTEEEVTMATKKDAPAKKPAPAKKAAPAAAKKEAAAKKTKTPKSDAPAAARPGRPPAYDANGAFKVVDSDAVKRGAFRAIVDAALSIGATFTIAELEKACRKIELSENQLMNTFAFGMRKGVFAQA